MRDFRHDTAHAGMVYLVCGEKRGKTGAPHAPRLATMVIPRDWLFAPNFCRFVSEADELIPQVHSRAGLKSSFTVFFILMNSAFSSSSSAGRGPDLGARPLVNPAAKLLEGYSDGRNLADLQRP